MGSCSSKQINDTIQVSLNIISQIVDMEKSQNDTDIYKNLLSMMYNLDKYPKEQQKMILQYVENKIRI